MKNPFLSKAMRLGLSVPPSAASAANGPVASASAETGLEAVMERLPRGTNTIRRNINRKESARWARPDEIAGYERMTGDLVLGKHAGRFIGSRDDKPLLTVASARSGKTATVLKPSLYAYRGPMLVLDPKGELAAATAQHRRDRLCQQVYVLDPFGCSGLASSCFNPLQEIDVNAASCVDDVDAIAQALILSEHGDEGSHWTNSAEALVRGLILYALTLPPQERNLKTVRELLMLTYPALEARRQQIEAEGGRDPEGQAQNELFMAMRDCREFGGALAGTGSSFLRKADRERAGIISTAETQMRFLDSRPVQQCCERSDFLIGELAGQRATTIYLCLPAGKMESHFRWLRLVVRMALLALERRGTWERGRRPIVFMMEEFATLGHMPIMEQAAAYFPGFGVRLWAVIQDLNQLKRHYRQSWETFVGNAGVLQFFGNGDGETLGYISDRLGSLSFVRGQFGAVGKDGDGSRDFIDKERLVYQHELASAFARDTGAQLLMMHGMPPMAVQRLSFADVDGFRDGVLW